MMKVFVSNDFHGVWPVGTAAVITAETKEEAEHLLIAELNTRGLKQEKPFAVYALDLSVKAAIILNDGNY